MYILCRVFVLAVLGLITQTQSKGLTLIQVLKLADSEAFDSVNTDGRETLMVPTSDLTSSQSDDLDIDLGEIDLSQLEKSCSHGKCCIQAKWFKACVIAEVLKKDVGFRITVVIDGHTVFKKEISVKNPPPFCFGVPALKQISDVCLKIYEVDLQTKSACVKLEFKVRILHKKVSLKVGCFKLSLDETSQRIEDSGVAEKTDLIPVALPDVTTFTDIELTPDHLTNQLRDCSQGKCKFCKKEIIDVCIEADALSKNIGFDLKLTVNGHKIMEKNITVPSPPPYCFPKTPFEDVKDLCLTVYKINLKELSACVKISATVKKGPFSKKIEFEIACFKIKSGNDDRLRIGYPYDTENTEDVIEVGRIKTEAVEEVLTFVSNKFL